MRRCPFCRLKIRSKKTVLPFEHPLTHKAPCGLFCYGLSRGSSAMFGERHTLTKCPRCTRAG